jgi:ceramide glucosyltransferase
VTVSELAAGVTILWSSVVAAASGVALWRSRAPTPVFSHGREGQSIPVLLVRPCAGAEPSLLTNLLSTREVCADARAHFAVASESDAAWPIACEAAARLRDEGFDVTATLTHAASPNQKSAQLARTIERHGDGCDVVVNIDSDVDLTGASLRDGIAHLVRSSKLAAVWWPPVETRGTTLGDRASEALLAGSLHAFPLLRGIDRAGLVGKTVALRRAALDDIGGFRALEQHLGEDMELAQRLRSRGWRVESMPRAVVARVQGRSWDAAVTRYGRWFTVIRAQRPALMVSYPALFFATPLILALALCGVALSQDHARAIFLLAAALIVITRLAVALGARRASGHPVTLSQAVEDTLLADGLMACAFVRALRTREVVWRGRRLTIDRAGVLREAEITP